MIQFELEQPTMEDIVSMCKDLAPQIKLFRPSCILAIGYGGIFPAALIGKELGLPIHVIRVSRYDDDCERTDVTLLDTKYSGKLMSSNMHIVVVDDVADTGVSLDIVYQHLRAIGIPHKNIEFCTLHLKKTSKVIPRWYATITDKWILYPWESTQPQNDRTS